MDKEGRGKIGNPTILKHQILNLIVFPAVANIFLYSTTMEIDDITIDVDGADWIKVKDQMLKKRNQEKKEELRLKKEEKQRREKKEEETEGRKEGRKRREARKGRRET